MNNEKTLEQRYLDAGICGTSIPLSEAALHSTIGGVLMVKMPPTMSFK